MNKATLPPITIDGNEYDKFKTFANQANKSMSQVMRELIEQWNSEQQNPTYQKAKKNAPQVRVDFMSKYRIKGYTGDVTSQNYKKFLYNT